MANAQESAEHTSPTNVQATDEEMQSKTVKRTCYLDARAIKTGGTVLLIVGIIMGVAGYFLQKHQAEQEEKLEDIYG